MNFLRYFFVKNKGVQPVGWIFLASILVFAEINFNLWDGVVSIFYWNGVYPLYRAYSPVVLAIVSGLLPVLILFCAFSLRLIGSLSSVAYIIFVIVFASKVKLEYLGVPLSISDIKFFWADLSANVDLFANYPMLTAMLFAACVGFLLLCYCSYRFEKPIFNGMQVLGVNLARLVLFGLGFLVLFLNTYRAEGAGEVNRGKSQIGKMDQAFFKMDNWFNQRPDGVFLLKYFFESSNVAIRVPSDSHQNRFAIATSESQINDAGKPDILVVLEESTFDPGLLQSCVKYPCSRALLQPSPNSSSHQSGPLLVHTTGGGTWLSEYAFLSRLDWRFFGAGGAFAPVSLAPRTRLTLPHFLKQLGYRTIAVYPVKGNFLNARKAYVHYGFDEFLSTEELTMKGAQSDWRLLHDGEIFSKALEYIERSNIKQPVFVFILTIRNHGPHGNDLSGVAGGYGEMLKAGKSDLADYLTRMDDSAGDYAALRRSWLNSSRHRVLAWFGDHQPRFTLDHWSDEKNSATSLTPGNVSPDVFKYLTYYLMESNFGGKIHAPDKNALDLVFLADELVKFSGLGKLPESDANQALRSKCSGIVYECGALDWVMDYVSFRIHDMKGFR